MAAVRPYHPKNGRRTRTSRILTLNRYGGFASQIVYRARPRLSPVLASAFSVRSSIEICSRVTDGSPRKNADGR
jgi:hypothetical protein